MNDLPAELTGDPGDVGPTAARTAEVSADRTKFNLETTCGSIPVGIPSTIVLPVATALPPAMVSDRRNVAQDKLMVTQVQILTAGVCVHLVCTCGDVGTNFIRWHEFRQNCRQRIVVGPFTLMLSAIPLRCSCGVQDGTMLAVEEKWTS